MLPTNAAGGSRARLNEAEEAPPACCCVGEAVGVDVELSNPLHLDLALTRLRLACSWEPAAGDSASTLASPEGGASSSSSSSVDTASEGFQVSRSNWQAGQAEPWVAVEGLPAPRLKLH